MFKSTTTQITILKPKKHISAYKLLIYTMYAACIILQALVKNNIYKNFLTLPLEQQRLNHTWAEIEDAKEFNYKLEEIENTKNNVIEYWTEGNEMYKVIRLLLLVPSTFHLCYLLFHYWSVTFRAHASFTQTKDIKEAHYALLNVTHKTGMENEIHKIYLLKIYHYFYNQKYYQQVEFENEKYHLINENGTIVLEEHFKGETELIPQFYDVENGLTNKQHYYLKQQFGDNRIVLKFPQYSKILRDELLTPYFGFQVFSHLIYYINGFGAFSLMQLGLLLFSQGANVYSKYNSLKSTCKLAPKPVEVTVIRDGERKAISSADIVPGDLVVYERDQYNHLSDQDDSNAENEQANPVNPMSMMLKNPQIQIIMKLSKLIFGKYYDENIYKNLNKIKKSLIFPADMLLIKGQLIADESILTGEQASQIKESTDSLQLPDIQPFNNIYSGTKLIQIQSSECHLLVVKTAQQTEQGKLIKTIAFNEERMNITTKDSVYFLFVMVIAAIVFAVYTFMRSYKNKLSSLTNLILRCLIIFIDVIPPDLPTQLSLVIGNSIREMRLKKIFSSEPHRILNAGRANYICFDKSGTLTQTNIKILDIDDKLTPESFKQICSKIDKPTKQQIDTGNYTKMIVAGCQSLTFVKNKIIGDKLELNAIEAIGAQFENDKIIYNVDNKPHSLSIIKRFYFNSNIKRMSAIITQNNKHYLVTKGSPESVSQLLKQVPANFNSGVNNYTKKGLRILALAMRELQDDQVEQNREDLEQQLQFCGLLVCETPLKKDTSAAISILKKALFEIRVISGDHVLNVAISALKCGIIANQENILIIEGIENEKIMYSCLDETDSIKTCDFKELQKLKGTICLTNSNNALQKVLTEKSELAKYLLQRSVVFARTTPEQKQIIVNLYQQVNSQSKAMFVGDGVNDLNALQTADVGIALLEEETEQVIQKREKKEVIPYPSFMIQPGNKPAGMMDLVNEAQRRAAAKHTNPTVEMQILIRETTVYKQYLKMQNLNNLSGKNGLLTNWVEAFDAEECQDDIRMGDATIAAQFTVKSGSLEGVLDIVRQGRCALAMVQMNFKQSALQCLVAAYSFTALTLNGVRSSNQQMIVATLLQLAVMLNISKAKQLKQISSKQPPKTIVGTYLIVSTILQALIHMIVLYFTQLISGSQMQTTKWETSFSPSLVNTCVYFVQMFMDACVVLVNYPGKPFMESLWKNRALKLSFIGFLAGLAVLLLEMVPELNQMLGLVQLPQKTQVVLILLCLTDFALCAASEFVSVKLFS